MTDDVLVRVERGIGLITLNRPKALNALTLPMILAIDAALAAWARNPAVRLVLLDGAGERGLCAGGDIRALYDAALAGDITVPETFFRAEYRLNARIARFGKPYVAFMDGIVMGGGIGLSAHGSHRVVTERSRLAMPETGIGFMPDVGATWLLGRAPGQLGLHMALTAGQMAAADAITLGLADTHVPSDRLPALAAALADSADAAEVSACLEAHATPPSPGHLAEAEGWIARCYAAEDMEQIRDALGAQPEPLARQAEAAIAGKSPSSLKLTLRAIREAPGLGSLEACLEQEYRLALACMPHHDFREGVRAAVIDKDRAPRWSPSALEAVTPAMIDEFFSASDHGGLKLG